MDQKEKKYSNYVKLPASQKVAPKANNLGISDLNEVIDITIRICRKKSIEDAIKQSVRMTLEEYENEFGASEDAINLIEDFAHNFNLTIVESDKARRSVILKGTVSNFENAFQVHLSTYRDGKGHTFRGRSGHINIPQELANIVEGVFGLDNRPHATPKFKVSQRNGIFVPHDSSNGYAPNALGSLYNFPTGVNGLGQCIAIIELGGGYRTTDLNNYFTGLGLVSPSIISVSIDNGINAPTVSDSSDGEVMLDIEVAGAIAPGAKIVVYFAANTDQGFLDAITTAIHDTTYRPTVISISWGSAENNWTEQSLNSFNEAFKAASILGVTICVASGDEGSSDGEDDGMVHVDFPASSPFVLACGGTSLVSNNNAITSETVWHDSDNSAGGGGISDFFLLPDYQLNSNVPLSLNAQNFKGRGLPDVAGNADPNTGYNVLVDGQQMVIGGTSAVAPLYAGLIALINQQRGNTAGFINPYLYNNPTLCRDIVQGDNITADSNLGFKAGPGWDACTGLGVLSKL